MSDFICEIDRREIDGFTIVTNALAEDHPCDWLDGKELKEFYNDLESGRAVYFLAQVIALKNGIELSTVYLGSCHYRFYCDFVERYNADYWRDMVDEAINEAKQAIKGLCEAA